LNIRFHVSRDQKRRPEETPRRRPHEKPASFDDEDYQDELNPNGDSFSTKDV